MTVRSCVKGRHVATHGEGIGLHAPVAHNPSGNGHTYLELERLAFWVGLEIADERWPRGLDAVLVDMYMPGMDGLATMRELRRLDQSIPIIVMSGQAFIGTPDFLGMEIMTGLGNGLLEKAQRLERRAGIRVRKPEAA